MIVKQLFKIIIEGDKFMSRRSYDFWKIEITKNNKSKVY